MTGRIGGCSRDRKKRGENSGRISRGAQRGKVPRSRKKEVVSICGEKPKGGQKPGARNTIFEVEVAQSSPRAESAELLVGQKKRKERETLRTRERVTRLTSAPNTKENSSVFRIKD